MIQVLLALLASVAQSLGGKTGALLTQLVNTVGVVWTDKAAWEAWATPWVVWANGIVDANRDPTAEEDAAANAVADAIHQRNQTLAAGTPVDQLPPLPNPPGS